MIKQDVIKEALHKGRDAQEALQNVIKEAEQGETHMCTHICAHAIV